MKEESKNSGVRISLNADFIETWIYASLFSRRATTALYRGLTVLSAMIYLMFTKANIYYIDCKHSPDVFCCVCWCYLGVKWILGKIVNKPSCMFILCAEDNKMGGAYYFQKVKCPEATGGNRKIQLFLILVS